MHRTEKRTKHRILYRVLLIVLIVAVLAGVLSFVVFAQTSYVITDGENVTVCRSFSSDLSTVLNEAGISLGAEDTYTTAYADGVKHITIQRLQTVTIVYRGMKTTATSYGEPVSQLLERMGIFLSDGDTLSCDRDAMTHDGLQVEIIHRGTEVLTQDEVIPFETVYYEDETLAPDEEVILVQGKDGMIHRETEISYENGNEISRKTLSESTTSAMVKQVVLCGINRIIMEQPEEKEPVRSSAGSGSSSSSSSNSGSSSSSSSSSASSKEDKPASSKEETSSSKEEKPASSKEEKPASSSSNGTSESAGSSSKVEKPASSAASSKEEKPVSSSQSSSSSKEEKPASSKEEKPASSKTEVSASKEAAN